MPSPKHKASNPNPATMFGSLSLSLLLCAGVAARNDPPTIAAEGDQLRVDAADMVCTPWE